MTDAAKEGPPRLERVNGLLLANLIAVAACFVFALVSYGGLPERYPAHWDLSGEVDRWTDKALGEWLIMPIIAAVLAALMVLLAVKLPRIPPGYYNVPDKERFVALSTAQRAPFFSLLARLVLLLTLLQTLVFLAIEWGMYAGALGQSWTPVWVVVGVIGAAYIGAIVVYNKALKAEIRRATGS